MRFFIVTTEPFPELHFYEPRGQGFESLLACHIFKSSTYKSGAFILQTLGLPLWQAVSSFQNRSHLYEDQEIYRFLVFYCKTLDIL